MNLTMKGGHPGAHRVCSKPHTIAAVLIVMQLTQKICSPSSTVRVTLSMPRQSCLESRARRYLSRSNQYTRVGKLPMAKNRNSWPMIWRVGAREPSIVRSPVICVINWFMPGVIRRGTRRGRSLVKIDVEEAGAEFPFEAVGFALVTE